MSQTSDDADIDAKETPPKKAKKIKRPRKQMSKKKIAIWSVVLIIFILWYWGTRPLYIVGTQLFGVCRTYIELNVQYPSELRFIDIRERGPDVTVEYMTTDSFGQDISHQGTCMFKR